jgi:hypothetical protein
MDVTPSLLLQADNTGHGRDKEVSYQLSLQSRCLELSSGSSAAWTGTLPQGALFGMIFFGVDFVKINSTVLETQHYLSARVMNLFVD